jgi:probable rRNA maturation factor
MKPIAAWRGEGVHLLLRNRQRTRLIDARFLGRIAKFLLRECFGCERSELGVHLVSAPAMAKLNEQFLAHAGPTDVITFDYGEEPQVRAAAPRSSSGRSSPGRHRQGRGSAPMFRGDVLICVDVAVAQARRYRTTWQKEVVRYLIHGLLHLQGYDDSASRPRRQMKQAEDRLVRRVSRRFVLSDLALPTPGAQPAKCPSRNGPPPRPANRGSVPQGGSA